MGRELTVNGERFTVIGSSPSRGARSPETRTTRSTCRPRPRSACWARSDLSSIIVKAVDPENIDLVKAKIEQTLRPGFGDEFTVFTQEQTLGILSTLLGTLTAMLAGIAGISLLVGGIGIMNIMLVSVSERTREIGIRKAVGAQDLRHHEPVRHRGGRALGAGGAIGIALGWGGAAALTRWVPTEITWWAVALAFFFSAAVGIFFGVYPAWRASRLDPIEALRYE